MRALCCAQSVRADRFSRQIHSISQVTGGESELEFHFSSSSHIFFLEHLQEFSQLISSLSLDRCQTCNFTIEASFVMKLLTRLYDELDAIGGNDVVAIETFMSKYAKVLHRNHYVFLSAKHSLCQLYGKVDGFLINEMSRDELKRKQTLCEELLEVIDILEPGTSRLRGVVLYELHAPMMMAINREMEAGSLKMSEYKRRLRGVATILSKAHEILALEPDGSSEKQMAVAAKAALESLKGI